MAFTTAFTILAMIAAASVMSFTPSRNYLHSIRGQKLVPRAEQNTRISYKNLSEEEHTNDANGASGNSELNTKSRSVIGEPTVRSIRERSVTREQSVRSIRNVEDFKTLALEEDEKLVIIRFHAPWCRVCKATDVAYERCAAKIQKAYPSQVKFLSANFDGKEKMNELRDLLLEEHHTDVRGVPMGMLFHPSYGVVGNIRLTRKHLMALKLKLKIYFDGEDDLLSLLDDSSICEVSE